MSLKDRRQELERLGFRIVDETDDTLVGVQRRFHWDCALTKLTYVLFVREVDQLTESILEADRESLSARARDLDPSILPRGFQKGTAVVTAYLARSVTPGARELCDRKPRVRFAFFYMPAVLDTSAGVATYLRSTPMWGALYYSKLRFLIGSVLEPTKAGGGWPISIGGALMTIFLLLVIAFNLAIILKL
ncbi:MAG: hypothetical protein R3B09_09960 [Nannocystaceae bacterium]